MRITKIAGAIPFDQEFVWITHLPNFSIVKFKVKEVVLEKNGDMSIKLIDSNIYGDSITAKKRGKDHVMKKSYHLSEADAALRLREHYRNINTDTKDAMTKRVIGDAKDKEVMMDNINSYAENYPEMTI